MRIKTSPCRFECGLSWRHHNRFWNFGQLGVFPFPQLFNCPTLVPPHKILLSDTKSKTTKSICLAVSSISLGLISHVNNGMFLSFFMRWEGLELNFGQWGGFPFSTISRIMRCRNSAYKKIDNFVMLWDIKLIFGTHSYHDNTLRSD